jgi:hypothetical protein
LTTSVLTDGSGDALPIIQVTAQAPTAASAETLATAATTGLTTYLGSTAASERVSGADRLHVSSLGVSPASIQVRGPSPIVGVIVAAFTLLFGFLCIVLAALSREERDRPSVYRPNESLSVVQLPWPDRHEAELDEYRSSQRVQHGSTSGKAVARTTYVRWLGGSNVHMAPMPVDRQAERQDGADDVADRFEEGDVSASERALLVAQSTKKPGRLSGLRRRRHTR